MSDKQIKAVTVTLNPALDLTGAIDALNVGSVHRERHQVLHRHRSHWQ